jgi:hypothetical protein
MEQDMLNENSSELNWRNKLEDMNGFPGEILPDKNAVWEKLHSRLHQQPRRVKPLWYWTAAACLLVMIIVPFLIANKKPVAMIKNAPSGSLPQQQVIRQVLPLKENGMVNTSSVLNRKVIINPPKAKENNSQPAPVILFNNAIESKELAGKKEQKEIPFTVQIDKTIPVIDTPVENSVAAIPTRKKLKVVHINELGDPVEEAHNILPPSDYGAIKIMLIKQQVYAVSSVPPNSIGFNVSKNKNTHPN